MDRSRFEIVRRYIPFSPNTRPGAKMPRVLFLVAHDTGNPGATAEQHWNYFGRVLPADYRRNPKTCRFASAHTFIDDTVILELIPTGTGTDAPEKAWHVRYETPEDNRLFGNDANDTAIGTELCFGGRIDFAKAYERYVWYHALLCDRYGFEPARHIVGHFRLDPGRKTDPQSALARYGVSFAQFLRDVEAELARPAPSPTGVTTGSMPSAPAKLSMGVAQTIIQTWLSPEWFRASARGDRAMMDRVHRLANALRDDANGVRKLRPDEAQEIIEGWLSPAWFAAKDQAERDDLHRLANELRRAAGMPAE